MKQPHIYDHLYENDSVIGYFKRKFLKHEEEEISKHEYDLFISHVTDN